MLYDLRVLTNSCDMEVILLLPIFSRKVIRSYQLFTLLSISGEQLL